MKLTEAKLEAAISKLIMAHDAWSNGYKNNWPQQDALSDAIQQVVFRWIAHYGPIDASGRDTVASNRDFIDRLREAVSGYNKVMGALGGSRPQPRSPHDFAAGEWFEGGVHSLTPLKPGQKNYV